MIEITDVSCPRIELYFPGNLEIYLAIPSLEHPPYFRPRKASGAICLEEVF